MWWRFVCSLEDGDRIDPRQRKKQEEMSKYDDFTRAKKDIAMELKDIRGVCDYQHGAYRITSFLTSLTYDVILGH